MKNLTITITLVLLFTTKVAAQYQNQPLVTESHDQSETHIAVNPLNFAHRIAGWNDFRNDQPDAGFAITTDDGANWTIDLLENRGGWPGTLFNRSYDPVVAYNRSGVPYYCYIGRGSTIKRAMVAKTTNGGTNWTHTPVDPNGLYDDKPWIAIDKTGGTRDGYVYVAWTEVKDSSNYRIYRNKFAYSTNGGTSFTMSSSNPLDQVIAYVGPTPPPAITSEPLSSFPWTQIEPHTLGAVCDVAPNGDVYVAWMLANADGSGAIKVRKSTNGGSTFGSVILNRSMTVTFPFSIGRIDIRNFPSLAIDPNTGYIYIAYTHKEASGDLNVYYTYSTSAGTSWSASAVATETTTGHQFFPALSVDPTGKVILGYYDYRNSPNVDVYLAESTNNGFSFVTPNIKVTSGYTTNNPANSTWTHHYFGVASIVGFAYPLWTDYRNLNADIYFARVNRAPTSNAATATAGNGQRKLARDSNGTYHQVFETNQEIWYARKTTTDIEWNNYQRLSNGVGGGYSSPCIAERGGKIYVVWQQLNGSSYSVYFHKSTDGGTTWPSGNRQTLATNVGSVDPLPVIASPATNELMAVYRSGNNLKWKRSTNSGSTWPTSGTISAGSGETLNSPSVTATRLPWATGVTGLAYATKEIPNASHIITRYYYGSGPWSAANNLSSGLPGNLSQHSHPSVSHSGDANQDYQHVAWDAFDSQYASRVIIHRLGSAWGFGSQYNEYHYQTEERPSITGLTGNTAEMAFRTTNPDRFFLGYFNGSGWSIQFPTLEGSYTSFSSGNTQAKYVTTIGSAAPYEIRLSTTTFSKASLLAENAGNGIGSSNTYHRAVGLVDTASGEWLNVRVENFLVKYKDGSSTYVDFSTPPLDTAVLSSTEAWAALASTDFALPADAESLMVILSLAGENSASLSDGQLPLVIQFKAEALEDGASEKNFQPLTFVANASFNQSEVKMSVDTKGLNADTRLVFKTYISHQKTDKEVVASLGHIYHYTDSQESSPLKPLAYHAPSLPEDFALEQNYPNPFNPQTTIKYQISQTSPVTLKIYNLVGQEVRTLVDRIQPAGFYKTSWDGKDDWGRVLPSGIYLYRIQAGEFVEVKKMTLVK